MYVCHLRHGGLAVGFWIVAHDHISTGFLQRDLETTGRADQRGFNIGDDPPPVVNNQDAWWDRHQIGAAWLSYKKHCGYGAGYAWRVRACRAGSGWKANVRQDSQSKD